MSLLHFGVWEYFSYISVYAGSKIYISIVKKKSDHHQHAINLGLVLAVKNLFVVSFVACETMAAFEGNWTADFGIFDLGMQPLKHAASQLWHSLQLTVALTSAFIYRSPSPSVKEYKDIWSHSLITEWIICIYMHLSQNITT